MTSIARRIARYAARALFGMARSARLPASRYTALSGPGFDGTTMRAKGPWVWHRIGVRFTAKSTRPRDAWKFAPEKPRADQPGQRTTIYTARPTTSAVDHGAGGVQRFSRRRAIFLRIEAFFTSRRQARPRRAHAGVFLPRSRAGTDRRRAGIDEITLSYNLPVKNTGAAASALPKLED